MDRDIYTTIVPESGADNSVVIMRGGRDEDGSREKEEEEKESCFFSETGEDDIRSFIPRNGHGRFYTVDKFLFRPGV